MIIDALDRYSAALKELGSDAPTRLLPGDPPESVRATLRQHEIQPSDEVVAFFAWSSGTGPDGPQFFTDLTLTSVSTALEIRRELLTIAREAALDDERASSDDFFNSTWVPLGPSDPQLVIDTGPGPTHRRVLAVWWDQPPTTVASTLEEFVEHRLAELSSGEVALDGDRFVFPNVTPVMVAVVVIRIRAGTDTLIPVQRERVRRAAAAAGEDLTAGVLLKHSGVDDIPSNSGLELYQRDLVINALVSDGVDQARITTEAVPLGEFRTPTHHLLGVFLQ